MKQMKQKQLIFFFHNEMIEIVSAVYEMRGQSQPGRTVVNLNNDAVINHATNVFHVSGGLFIPVFSFMTLFSELSLNRNFYGFEFMMAKFGFVKFGRRSSGVAIRIFYYRLRKAVALPDFD